MSEEEIKNQIDLAKKSLAISEENLALALRDMGILRLRWEIQEKKKQIADYELMLQECFPQ